MPRHHRACYVRASAFLTFNSTVDVDSLSPASNRHPLAALRADSLTRDGRQLYCSRPTVPSGLISIPSLGLTALVDCAVSY
jgi:hypothetical protein